MKLGKTEIKILELLKEGPLKIYAKGSPKMRNVHKSNRLYSAAEKLKERGFVTMSLENQGCVVSEDHKEMRFLVKAKS